MATTIHIRSYHLDGYGHVNNARYLEFLEEARWAWFEAGGLLPLLGDTKLVVARIDIRYRRSATEGERLDIHSRLSDIQPRRLQVSQSIILQSSGKVCVEAEVSLMPVLNGRAVSLSPELQQQLTLLPTP